MRDNKIDNLDRQIEEMQTLGLRLSTAMLNGYGSQWRVDFFAGIYHLQQHIMSSTEADNMPISYDVRRGLDVLWTIAVHVHGWEGHAADDAILSAHQALERVHNPEML
jgi:hypothetical protein